MSESSKIAKLLVKSATTGEARADKTIGGDMKGDGLQNGGVLIVAKGGEVLLSFKQDSPADHVENCEILKALKLQQTPTDSQKGDAV